MKRLILVLVCFIFVGLVYSEELIDKPSGEIAGLTTVKIEPNGDYVYTITLKSEHQKVLDWQVVSPLKWIDNAVLLKINNSSGRMLKNLTNQRVNTLTKAEKETLIKNSTLKTRKERDEAK